MVITIYVNGGLITAACEVKYQSLRMRSIVSLHIVSTSGITVGYENPLSDSELHCSLLSYYRRRVQREFFDEVAILQVATGLFSLFALTIYATTSESFFEISHLLA
jgi:hypothetical protein